MTVRVASIALGLIAATTFVAVPSARAQCRLCSTPTTSLESESTTKGVALDVQAGLNFDRLIVLGIRRDRKVLLNQLTMNVQIAHGSRGAPNFFELPEPALARLLGDRPQAAYAGLARQRLEGGFHPACAGSQMMDCLHLRRLAAAAGLDLLAHIAGHFAQMHQDRQLLQRRRRAMGRLPRLIFC